MWIFTTSGLLMPALVPASGKADPRLTENGKYDLQVRGRLESHLRYFMDNYMVPGTFHDEIEHTPQMDYNVRFYTTHEAFAEGVKNSILDIDYQNFKHMVERKGPDGAPKFGPDASKYHGVLNSIWATVQRLNTPGGLYGPKSAENPRGYSTSWNRGSGSYGTPRDRHEPMFYDGALGTQIGSSFYEDDELDYIPGPEQQKRDLLAELEDVPLDQWEDYLSTEEFELIRDEHKKAVAVERKWDRKFRAKARKKAKERR